MFKLAKLKTCKDYTYQKPLHHLQQSQNNGLFYVTNHVQSDYGTDLFYLKVCRYKCKA